VAEEAKGPEGSEHEADTVGADDPLFVPRLDLLLGARGLSDRAAEQDLYSWAVETICGATDDSQAVEQYAGNLGVSTAFVNSHQGAVAQVQWNNNLAGIYTDPGNVSGARWGSGTMISANLFLTCGHLFDQTGGNWQRPRRNGTNTIISPQEIALNMHLNFNYQVDSNGNQRPEQGFAITELIEFRLGGVDFAVCRIAGNPGEIFGTTSVSTADAAVNDMLCIIGHPAGLPKRVEAGPATSFSGNRINYNDIDTLGGNSGSGILHSGSGTLVGVHTNGGCNVAGTGSNFGMRISAVREHSPTLQTL
jgi:V8-like Glu-specific endopeptidase